MTNSDIIDNFQVQYKHGAGTLKVSESQEEVIQSQGSLGQTSVSPSTVELAQLQILHRARKRKLEEVTNEFSRKEKEYERQMRVMNHKLALMKGTLSLYFIPTPLATFFSYFSSFFFISYSRSYFISLLISISYS